MRSGSPAPGSTRARLAAVGFFAALLLPLAAQDGHDPARAIKSKDVGDRLAAIEALRTTADPQGEKLLLGALGDRDLEVIEKAAAALAERGTDAAVAPLVRLCIDGDLVRARRTAARTLAKIAPVKGAAELVKLTSGKSAVPAFEALGIVAGAAGEEGAAAIQRGLRSKDAALRRAAASGIAGLPDAAADEALTGLLKGPDRELAAIALNAVRASAEVHFLVPLFAALHEPQVPDVLERRMIAAAAACTSTLEKAGKSDESVKELAKLAALGPFASAEAEARAARLYAALDAVALPEAPLHAALAPLLSAAMASAKPAVRKAALVGAVERALPGAKDAALSMAAKDPDASVRLVALCKVARSAGAADAAVAPVLVECLANDADPSVREAAAVALGAPDVAGAAAALVRGLGDAHWSVVTCCAVSLGKTRDAATALEPLQRLQMHADWRQRASATVGLCWLMSKDAVPSLIQALGDPDPSVKRSAFVFLEAQLKAKLPEERAAWEAWWKANGERVHLIDPQEARKTRERYGYASKTESVYENLDVVVLESRGDNIQRLLGQLKIAHRLTQASKVSEAALHPGAIYVSNCTGEIEPKDVERIAWYVRAGGVLFGSCWSLHETIERVSPGVLRHLETQAEVVDDVAACAVDPSNPYLKNVFGQDIEPLYNLSGSHLIEVLEPELCEVLIDSPQALARWGGGNLAATFRSGHGVILDSANHFDLQGLQAAPGLRTSAERIAFAFDRMGLDYETWRRTKDEKWWDSAMKASQNVLDWSALWFVTNFVRAKRLSDG
ncbi:MAG TPA: HEAT repeat domain-containing protein [Planctomycetota bacterium]|nr:HEAT repeat domain-containing protein [Planctomycetota bacterium]